MSDLLDETRREITDRLAELKPLVEEYNRLEAAASALAGLGKGAPRPEGARKARAKRRRGAGRPAGSRGKQTASPAKGPGRPKGRAGRRKGSGTRAAEALSFVQGQPGITIPELAAKMGIKQNYLYRVLPTLEQERLVEKQGRRWYATQTRAAARGSQAIFPADEVWCPRHQRYHSPPAHK